MSEFSLKNKADCEREKTIESFKAAIIAESELQDFELTDFELYQWADTYIADFTSPPKCFPLVIEAIVDNVGWMSGKQFGNKYSIQFMIN